MRSDLVAAFTARAQDLLQAGRFQNFAAQSHSRAVLRYLGTPPDEWPAYTGTLDEDLAYTAQYLLYLGMRMKEQPETESSADANLTLGAELLEHIYGRADDEDPERITQLFTAALAYYMSGHFARAFVLVRDLEATGGLPRFVTPLRHLLLKEFSRLRAEVIQRLVQLDYADDEIARLVDEGELSEDEAYCRVFEATLYRAVSFFLEYTKSGVTALIDTAAALLDDAVALATDLRFADWWWYFSCVRSMITSYRRHSFWENLAPLLAETQSEPLARRYIQANLRLPTPVIELWPSQVTAVPFLFGKSARKRLCLRMPTSAGKTKVAELAILGFLAKYQGDSEAKSVYVAPFRSLAVEVEHTLKRVFFPLGARVSELYGGFELTAADKVLIEKTQILVATPEKLDALFRFSPELVGAIKLIILDEGHIISPNNYKSLRRSRGLKYEVFLHRLVTRLESTDTRILFLSAVMPNAEQFAEWITGDKRGLVTSEWRPSRLMLGEAVWDGKRVSLRYTHANQKPLEVESFVRSFVTQREAGKLLGKRKKPFPKDDSEALAQTALEFAARGLTMVFVARKASAEPLGRTIREAIENRRRFAKAAGATYELPVDAKYTEDVNRCARLIRENMGEDCDLASFLQAGFVVHHGSLPQAVRLELERLVRTGAVRLVVATTTLAQGVNFPIHTVLVHSLDHGQDDPVSPMDFWNVCGRAGRGMRENEGQVLFFANEAFDEWKSGRKWAAKLHAGTQRRRFQQWCDEQRKRRSEYVSQYGSYTVTSALRDLVRKIVDLWRAKHSTVNVPELCEALANHTLSLFAPSEEIDLESLLSLLDGLLIALTEERDEEVITADTFQEILQRSLLHLQLTQEDTKRLVNEMFAARIRYIRKRHAAPAKRKQFFRLGLPLRDCEKIDSERDALLKLYLKAARYLKWTAEERSQHLTEVATFLFQLTEIAPSHAVPASWERIMLLWLSGHTPTEIAGDSEVETEGLSAQAVSRWLDETCGYRLPWGYNVLALYLKDAADAAGEEWPDLCDFYSAFAKYGVHEPVACWLLTFGVPSRKVAMRAAKLIGDAAGDPDSLLKWLQRKGLDELEQRGMDEDGLAKIREAVLGLGGPAGGASRRGQPINKSYRVPQSTCPPLVIGDRLLLQRVSKEMADGYRVYTVRGEKIARFKLAEDEARFWELLSAPELLDVVVEQASKVDQNIKFRVNVVPV